MPRFIPFLKAIVGFQPKTFQVLGRPVPPGMQKWEPVVVMHDRSISAGIFSRRVKSKTSNVIYAPLMWKSYQDRSGHWHVSTGLFPNEIDPALMLLQECRRRMSVTPVVAP